MRSYREEISNQTIIAKVLRSLTLKFDHVVAAIEESKDLATYSFDELMGSLQSYEARLCKSDEKNEEKVFHVKGEAASRRRGKGGYRDRGSHDKNDRGRGDGQRNEQYDQRTKTNYVKEEEEIKLFMAYEDSRITLVEGKCTVAIKNNNGNIKLMHNIYFVTSLIQDLLSIG
ncbi:hypothetical protein MANES_04G012950v8 [Manihot esculenta]|uniref:Uncharacterized protein n=1 Tax=Manihot esculenta TaxID=3983 RepID=A0ACB7HR40_MANES|nr:hypothetical protein MANES_04G012950v8 [Manihot esculenta]